MDTRNNDQTGEEEYMVKWKGYEQPTWEPARVISHLAMFEKYKQRQAQLQAKVEPVAQVSDQIAAPVVEHLQPAATGEETTTSNISCLLCYNE